MSQKDKTKTEFVIPELPEGRLLEFKIYSNWGDKYLVGLNGIELFDTNGELVSFEKVRWNTAIFILNLPTSLHSYINKVCLCLLYFMHEFLQ